MERPKTVASRLMPVIVIVLVCVALCVVATYQLIK